MPRPWANSGGLQPVLGRKGTGVVDSGEARVDLDPTSDEDGSFGLQNAWFLGSVFARDKQKKTREKETPNPLSIGGGYTQPPAAENTCSKYLRRVNSNHLVGNLVRKRGFVRKKRGNKGNANANARRRSPFLRETWYLKKHLSPGGHAQMGGGPRSGRRGRPSA